MQRSRIVKYLGVDPDKLNEAKASQKPDEQTDWLKLASDSINGHVNDLLNMERRADGVRPKDVTRKSINNKAIMREIAGLRSSFDAAMSSMNDRVQRVEQNIIRERCERRALSIMFLFHVYNPTWAANNIGKGAPDPGVLIEWFERQLETDPNFDKIASRMANELIGAAIQKEKEAAGDGA